MVAFLMVPVHVSSSAAVVLVVASALLVLAQYINRRFVLALLMAVCMGGALSAAGKPQPTEPTTQSIVRDCETTPWWTLEYFIACYLN